MQKSFTSLAFHLDQIGCLANKVWHSYKWPDEFSL